MSRLLIARGLRLIGVLLNFKWRASGGLSISDLTTQAPWRVRQ